MDDDEWRNALLNELRRIIEYQDKRIERLQKTLDESILSEDLLCLDGIIQRLRAISRQWQYAPRSLIEALDALEMIFRNCAIWKQEFATRENARIIERAYFDIQLHPEMKFRGSRVIQDMKNLKDDLYKRLGT